MKNDDRLWNEHVLPALEEMYGLAENIFGADHKFTFDEVCSCAPTDRSGERRLPSFAFCLDPEKYKEIKREHSKGFRHWWKWPYRSEIYKDGEELQAMKDKLKEMEGLEDYEENQEYQELKEDIELNIEFKRREELWEEYKQERDRLDRTKKKKEITTKEYNEKSAELAKKYGCRWYSIEEEKVKITIDQFCPDAQPERFHMMKIAYNFAKEGKIDEMPDELYGRWFPYGVEVAKEEAKMCVDFYNNLKKNKIIQ